jgi:hypothetical protein
MTYGGTMREVRLLFRVIDEHLVLVQKSKTWDDGESDWVHLFPFRG